MNFINSLLNHVILPCPGAVVVTSTVCKMIGQCMCVNSNTVLDYFTFSIYA